MDHPTVAAAAASSGVAVLIAAGVPPDLVWLAALSGGLLSLWSSPPSSVSWAWLVGAFGRLAMSLALGVAGAAALPAVLAGYAYTAPLAATPTPVWALLCSLFAPSLHALGLRWLDARVRSATAYPTQAAATARATQEDARNG